MHTVSETKNRHETSEWHTARSIVADVHARAATPTEESLKTRRRLSGYSEDTASTTRSQREIATVHRMYMKKVRHYCSRWEFIEACHRCPVHRGHDAEPVRHTGTGCGRCGSMPDAPDEKPQAAARSGTQTRVRLAPFDRAQGKEGGHDAPGASSGRSSKCHFRPAERAREDSQQQAKSRQDEASQRATPSCVRRDSGTDMW